VTTYGVVDREAHRRERRRGRRLGVGLLVFLLVVVVLLVVADRVGAWYAERRIADEVQQEVAQRDITSDRPDVQVGGFPFVTQVLSGEYKSVKIKLRDVDGGGIRLPELDVEATGVHADLQTIRTGQGEARADEVTGTATVGYATVAALANQPGLQLSAQNGQLRVRLPVQILGEQVILVGSARMRVDNNRIRVTVSDLDDESGNLPAQARAIASGYASRLSVSFQLPPLPFQLTVDEVTAESKGLAVTATAHGVPITS
jgi:LmeA-like phospholipid-binding